MSIDAISDHKLAHLRTITDAHLMANRFIACAAELAADAVITDCAVEKIYYRPGHSCTVLYRLGGCDAAGAPFDQWICGKAYPPNRARKRFNEALALAPAQNEGNGHATICWQPAVFWADLDLVLRPFPADAKLPILAKLADAEFVKGEINANRACFGWPATGSVESVRMARIKYMPGKRCVLRYEAAFRDAQVAASARFFSKTYFDGRSRHHFHLLQAAHQCFSARRSKVQIPRPLCHLDGGNTIWQEEWQGHALLDALAVREWPALFSRLAEAAADLHGSGLTNIPPAPDMNDVLQAVIYDAADLTALLPALQQPVSEWLARLQQTLPALVPRALPQAPIHGAFRLEQMLARGEEFALVDFDALARGDPLFDAAEFVASLQFLELSCGLPRPRLQQAAEGFMENYAALVPWPCERRRLAWYALAFLISKMFLAVKNLDRRALQQLDPAGIEICRCWYSELK